MAGEKLAEALAAQPEHNATGVIGIAMVSLLPSTPRLRRIILHTHRGLHARSRATALVALQVLLSKDVAAAAHAPPAVYAGDRHAGQFGALGDV